MAAAHGSQQQAQSSTAGAGAAADTRNLLADLPPALLERIVDPISDLLGALAVHLSCRALHGLLDTNVWRRVVRAEAGHGGEAPSADQEAAPGSWRALYLRRRPLCLHCEELAISLDVDTADLIPPRQRLVEGVLCQACWREHPDLRVVWSKGMLAALHEPVPVIWSGWLRLMFLGRHCYHSAAITARFLQLCGMLTQQLDGQVQSEQPQQPHHQQQQQQRQPIAPAKQQQSTWPATSHPPMSPVHAHGHSHQQQLQPVMTAAHHSQEVLTTEKHLHDFLLHLERSKLASPQSPQRATPAQQASKRVLTTAAALHQALPRLPQYVHTGRDRGMLDSVTAVLARHAALLAALQQQGIDEVPSSHQSKLCAQFLAGLCAIEPDAIAQKVAQSRFLHQHTDYTRRQQQLHAQEQWPDDDFDDVALFEGGGSYRLSWREAGEEAKQEVLQQYGGDFPARWPWQEQAQQQQQQQQHQQQEEQQRQQQQQQEEVACRGSVE